MSRLLDRQLKKFGLSKTETPHSLEEWNGFLELIDSVYKQAEEDRYLLERSLELSSREMNEQIEKIKLMGVQLAQTSKLAGLGTLASGVAHELNNPLAALKGYAEVLLHNPESLNEDTKHKLGRILKLSDRMAATIRNMLKLARQSVDGPDSSVDLRVSIADSLEMLRRQFEHDGVDLDVTFQASEPHIAANETQIISVLQNLLSNSRDAFLSHPEISVRKIQILVSDHESGMIELKFKDTAGGIPDEILGFIFDPFFTTKEAGAGTGLGLSISRQIIEELGGSLSVKTEPGKGTEFTLLMKRGSGQGPGDVESISKIEQVTTVFKLPERPLNVLVVDDEPDICELFRTSLSSIARTTVTSEPEEALRLVQEQSFDLLVTDLRMPRISGDLLIARARESQPKLNVVLISGHVRSPSDVADLNQCQPYLFIEKPLPSPKKLIQTIYQFYGRIQAREASVYSSGLKKAA